MLWRVCQETHGDGTEMSNNSKRKGNEGERLARKLLQDCGYLVVKSGGSLSEVDIVAIGNNDVRGIQVKVSSDSRMFQPAKLEAVRETLYDLPRPPSFSYEIWIRYKKKGDRKWYWHQEVVP